MNTEATISCLSGWQELLGLPSKPPSGLCDCLLLRLDSFDCLTGIHGNRFVYSVWIYINQFTNRATQTTQGNGLLRAFIYPRSVNSPVAWHGSVQLTCSMHCIKLAVSIRILNEILSRREQDSTFVKKNDVLLRVLQRTDELPNCPRFTCLFLCWKWWNKAMPAKIFSGPPSCTIWSQTVKMLSMASWSCAGSELVLTFGLKTPIYCTEALHRMSGTLYTGERIYCDSGLNSSSFCKSNLDIDFECYLDSVATTQ